MKKSMLFTSPPHRRQGGVVRTVRDPLDHRRRAELKEKTLLERKEYNSKIIEIGAEIVS